MVKGYTDVPYYSGKGGKTSAAPERGTQPVFAHEAGRALGQICIDTCMDHAKAIAQAQEMGFYVQGSTLVHRTHDFRIELGASHLGRFTCAARFLTLDRDAGYFNGLAAHRHLHVLNAQDGRGTLQLKGKNGFGSFTIPTGRGPSYGTVDLTLMNNI